MVGVFVFFGILSACWAIYRGYVALFSFEKGGTTFVTMCDFKEAPDPDLMASRLMFAKNLVEITLKNPFEKRTYRFHEKFRVWVDNRGRTISAIRVHDLKKNVEIDEKKAARRNNRLQAVKDLWG